MQPAPQPQTPPPAPIKTPPTPEQKRRNYIIVGVVAALIVGFIGVNAWQESRDSSDDTRAATTEQTTQTTTAAPTTTPRNTYTPPPARSASTPPRPAATTSPPAPAQLPAASSPQEAGCEDPDPTMVSTIEGAITDGRVLRDIAQVTDTVDGQEYIYLAANVFRADGETRSVSGVVWLSPGLGVVNLSGNSRDVTPEFLFGRGVFGNAGDDAGLKVQDCVAALFRGR